MEQKDIKNTFTERAISDVALQDDGSHIFVASDQSVDRHNSVFLAKGWDLTHFRNNPIVTIGHPDPNTHDDTLIIGRAEVWLDGNKLMARIYYDMENERAVRIKSKIERKFMGMVSIRAIAKSIDKELSRAQKIPHFDNQELVDLGIVMHGSNRNARKVDEVFRAFGIDDATDDFANQIDDEEEKPEPVDNTEARELIANILKNRKI